MPIQDGNDRPAWLALEPRGRLLHRLMDFIATHAATFSLVVRDDMTLHESAAQLLEALVPAVLNRYRTNEWPGTTLLGEEALMTVVDITEEAITLVKDASDHLYAWKQPELPEDPCFYRPDGSVLLAVIAHERAAFMMIDNDEERMELTKLGLTFEPWGDDSDSG